MKRTWKRNLDVPWKIKTINNTKHGKDRRTIKLNNP